MEVSAGRWKNDPNAGAGALLNYSSERDKQRLDVSPCDISLGRLDNDGLQRRPIAFPATSCHCGAQYRYPCQGKAIHSTSVELSGEWRLPGDEGLFKNLRQILFRGGPGG